MALNTAQNPTLEKLHKALALQKAGDYKKAQRLYQQVLKKVPNHPDANHLLGVTYRQLGKPVEAIAQIQKAINLAGDRAPFYSNLARAMSDIPKSDNDSILALTRKALDLDPTLIDAWNLHAITLCKFEMIKEAELIFQRLIHQHPNHPDAYRNYGVALRDEKHYEKAIVFFNKCCLLDPDNPEPFYLLSKSLQDKGDLKTAYKFTKHALGRFTDNDKLHHEFARICFKQGNSLEGLESAQIAAKAAPDNPDRQITLGVCLHGHHRYGEAVACFKRSMELYHGELPTAEWNMSLAYLGLGDLTNGWKHHHARFAADNLPVLSRKFNKPRWTGESLKDKTILVYADQGVGDALRSSTILGELIAVAGSVIVEGSQKLLETFEYSFPEATVRLATFEKDTLEATSEDYDFHVAMADLACMFRPTIASFKNAVFPSLKAKPERVQELYQRLPEDADKRPVVGISWRSKNLDTARLRNYFSVLEIAPILDLEDCIFLNLQYASVEKEIRFLQHKCEKSTFVHFPDVDQFNNLMDAAAMSELCDLIISAPTSVGDIAATHNVPCWTFGDSQSHFTLGQENSPWYPSLKHTMIDFEQTVSDLVPEIVERLASWKQTFSPDDRLRRIGRYTNRN